MKVYSSHRDDPNHEVTSYHKVKIYHHNFNMPPLYIIIVIMSPPPPYGQPYHHPTHPLSVYITLFLKM